MRLYRDELERRWLYVHEVARIFRVTRRQVNEWIREGRLNATGTLGLGRGGGFRVTRDEKFRELWQRTLWPPPEESDEERDARRERNRRWREEHGYV